MIDNLIDVYSWKHKQRIKSHYERPLVNIFFIILVFENGLFILGMELCSSPSPPPVSCTADFISFHLFFNLLPALFACKYQNLTLIFTRQNPLLNNA